jgi:hypothetical protein
MTAARNPIATPFGCIMLCLAIMGTASARDALPGSAQPADNEPNSGMHSSDAKVEGDHTMAATVVATDPETGIVDVTSDGMPLKLHFPAPSMAKLKTGDKITLHLGFTRP